MPSRLRRSSYTLVGEIKGAGFPRWGLPGVFQGESQKVEKGELEIPDGMNTFQTQMKEIQDENNRLIKKITDKYRISKYQQEIARERASESEKYIYDAALVYIEGTYKRRLVNREDCFNKAKEALIKRAMKKLSTEDKDSILEFVSRQNQDGSR